jgi:hypothetical protein
MRRVLALMLLTFPGAGFAAELQVTWEDGQLGARVYALEFPGTLSRELTSGLTNRLYVRATLEDSRNVIGQKVVEIAIRYDLWDQDFTLVTTNEGTIVDSRRIKGLPELNAFLAALPLPRMFDAANLSANGELRLRVDLLLNPIDREKMRMIRKWVAQNSTPQVGGEQGVSVSNAVFNRIFEQYSDGSNVAAAWRASVTSVGFRLDKLSNEGR